MSINVVLDIEKRDNLPDFLNQAIEQAIMNAASRIEQELAYLTPEFTGQLRATFRAVPTGTGIQLRWGTSYAEYVDAGAPPHTIVPKTAKALVFYPAGEPVFAKRVEHPGQPPQNFTTITGQRALSILKDELSKALVSLSVMVS